MNPGNHDAITRYPGNLPRLMHVGLHVRSNALNFDARTVSADVLSPFHKPLLGLPKRSGSFGRPNVLPETSVGRRWRSFSILMYRERIYDEAEYENAVSGTAAEDELV